MAEPKPTPPRMRGQIADVPADASEVSLFQVLDERGVAAAARVPQLSAAEWRRIYRGMQLIRIMDERLLALQRQGRIGFYGEARGQEAAVVGAAAALGPNDWIVPALREAGAAIYRGLPLRSYVAQIFGSAADVAKGRQLPCHPGTRDAKYVTMSSCIASQLPHAVGMAMAAKLRGDDAVVLGCLGDGATSEEDFHVAANFAGVYGAPVVFFCQNNQWAISTPVAVQTAAPTMAVKALAYGFRGVRCDGNDVLAVYSTVRDAVARARRGEGPTLVEALTYRVSAHSSSDDPSRYRDERVTEQWRTRDPIARFRTWLMAEGLLDEAAEAALRAELDGEVRDAVAQEERVGAPELRTLVEDVYAEVPAHLEEQLAELARLPRQKLGGVHQ
ncbi:MAG TPA: thiamine pyrophosphate-dependent enzyme [Polyangia bacterium]|jgi:pyruvate dehydrogenase E1 component alpha subunit/2-oxoisovalerate dehydrogenase E1 component alpha subunit|nr:thiamine pyrophosphate-dependent enzyme [Polyangia bacterium]